MAIGYGRTAEQLESKGTLKKNLDTKVFKLLLKLLAQPNCAVSLSP